MVKLERYNICRHVDIKLTSLLTSLNTKLGLGLKGVPQTNKPIFLVCYKYVLKLRVERKAAMTVLL